MKSLHPSSKPIFTLSREKKTRRPRENLRIAGFDKYFSIFDFNVYGIDFSWLHLSQIVIVFIFIILDFVHFLGSPVSPICPRPFD
jgi:hypothetical protein